MKKNITQLTAIILASFLLNGCQHQLRQHATEIHHNYNVALSQASSKEILLNIVRAYDHEAPSFLSISSITTSNSFTTPSLYLEQGGFSGSNLLASTIGSITTNGISYNPNITMTPNSGEQYANQLLTPLSLKNIGQISYAQANIGLLLRLTVAKLGPWSNYPPIPMEHNLNHIIQDEKNFQAFCDLAQEIYANNGHVLFFRKLDTPSSTNRKNSNAGMALFIPINQPFHFTPKQRALLKTLKIDPNSKHLKLLTPDIADEPNTIAIIPRTLVSTLKYLASMIQGVPQSQSVDSMQALLSQNFFTIHTSKKKPEHAYLSLEKDDRCYYILNDDAATKTTFEALELLFDITRIIPANPSTVLISN